MSVTSRKDWPLVQVEELAAKRQHALTIGPFGSDLKTSDYRASGVPVVFVRNVQPGRFVDATPRYVSDRKAKELAAHRVVPGDLVVTKMGLPPCVTAVYPDSHPEGIVTADIIKLSLDKRIADPTYVTLFLNSPFAQQQVGLITNGVTRPKVTLRDFKQLRIPLPPLPEQRRVAEVLDRAEALRAKRREALTHVDSLTESVFLDIFGDPVVNPRGWSDSATLGEVGEVVSGVAKGRKLNGKSTREVPYLAVSNVQDKQLSLAVVKTIDATDEEIERYRLRHDDLLLTEGGDPDKLGRGTLWRSELPECIHQNHVFRVRVDPDAINPLFLSWLVGSERGKRYFLRSAKQTTGIASINMTQLRGFPLLMPPLALQRDFARQAAAVEALRASNRASLTEMDALFASLQHRAFRGDL